MKPTTLLIARHGNTFTPEQTPTRVGARTDLPLVESGIQQGTLLGRYLKQEGLLPDVVFTSTLKRTQQTAQAALDAAGVRLPLTPLDIFNEIDYGVDENQPEDAVIARLGAEALRLWDEEAIVPSGWQVDPEAIITAWKHFAADLLNNHTGNTILVVTSNGIARFAPHLTGDFAAFRQQHPIKIATGALCSFTHNATTPYWNCTAWNLKPAKLLTSNA